MNAVAVTFEDMRTEIRREIGMRSRAYKKWIAAGTMTEADAERHTARMLAVSELFDELASLREDLPPALLRARIVQVAV